MAVGFGGADSVQDTIEATLCNAIDFARSQIRVGESEKFCLDCDLPIPEKRRQVVSGCQYCISCQAKRDKKLESYYNRRGSKDSQLR